MARREAVAKWNKSTRMRDYCLWQKQFRLARGRARLLQGRARAGRMNVAGNWWRQCARTVAFVFLTLSFPALGRDGPVPVDAELVIAVDVSYSMNQEEQKLQRSGYVAALNSPEFHNALKSGTNGSIAVTYMEWAGLEDQEVIMPWTLIDSPQAARAFAEALDNIPLRRANRTSISGGIDRAVQLYIGNGFSGTRKVIDVSGDGPNNSGRLVTEARDEAVAKGYIINGLPLVDIRPFTSPVDIKELDWYYADCVIGGPGAFMIPINSNQKFIDATRAKLVLEISMPLVPRLPLIVSVAAQEPRVPCNIGETLWKRWRGE